MKMFNSQQHSFHLVTPSPWPLVAALAAFVTTSGGVIYIHSIKNGGLTLSLGLLLLISVMGVWWRDVIRESTFEGNHTKLVQRGLRLGMLLFIVSEVIFFFAFFWAYFHSSLSPTIEIGSIWPPAGIVTFNPWGVPLLGTAILLYSGLTITAAHHYILFGNLKLSSQYLESTVALGFFFTLLQAFEYKEAPISISDGIYGSTFYITTGFHGFHVIIGTIFLSVCFVRLMFGHFTRQHHFGFEAAAWYWHFVDVVWLFLFVSVYWWGSI